MQTYNPLNALLIFIAIILLAYLLFRPTKGWFWIIKNYYYTNEKTVVEDILKFLYHSENEGLKTTKNELFSKLKFKTNLFQNSLEKMVANHFIVVDNSQVKLTATGIEYALRIIRVHRLWERFLAEKTGYDKLEWHQRAEQKEHQLNLEEANELAAKLGHPKFDPHGDPIPSKSGEMAILKGVSLSSLPVYTEGEIVHIEDEPEIVYKQILAENIHIGSHIKVLENNDTRITFYAEGEEFKLSPKVAENLTIAVVEKHDIDEKKLVRLTSLNENENATIIGLSKESRGESRRRLLDLGFVKGAKVSIDLINPLNEPIAYLIKGTSIALRKNQASKILIKKE